MKAFFATGFGGPAVMRFGDLPDPMPRRGEARVAVAASSINPADYKLRGGAMRFLPAMRRFPRPLGLDLAGVVDAVGSGVTAFAPGERVYGALSWMRGAPGAHAELVCAPVSRLRRMPAGLDFVDAAALPVAALTALAALRLGGDRAGKQVLVTGATGGVGHFAVQLARARGAAVTAICSAARAERARALGAQETLDYRTADLDALRGRFDLVVDAHAGLGWKKGSRLLAPGGAYASTVPSYWLATRGLWSSFLPIGRGFVANLRVLPEDFAELERHLESVQVRPIVEHVFPLERAAEAFALAEGGGFVGKIALKVR